MGDVWWEAHWRKQKEAKAVAEVFKEENGPEEAAEATEILTIIEDMQKALKKHEEQLADKDRELESLRAKQRRQEEDLQKLKLLHEERSRRPSNASTTAAEVSETDSLASDELAKLKEELERRIKEDMKAKVKVLFDYLNSVRAELDAGNESLEKRVEYLEKQMEELSEKLKKVSEAMGEDLDAMEEETKGVRDWARRLNRQLLHLEGYVEDFSNGLVLPSPLSSPNESEDEDGSCSESSEEPEELQKETSDSTGCTFDSTDYPDAFDPEQAQWSKRERVTELLRRGSQSDTDEGSSATSSHSEGG